MESMRTKLILAFPLLKNPFTSASISPVATTLWTISGTGRSRFLPDLNVGRWHQRERPVAIEGRAGICLVNPLEASAGQAQTASHAYITLHYCDPVAASRNP